MDSHDEVLAAYGRSLRECTVVLQGRSPRDPAVTRAFERLREDFERLGDLSAIGARLAGAERARFDERVEELAREHSVLVLSLSRDRERLLGLLQQGREARRACRASVEGPATGGTCDMTA